MKKRSRLAALLLAGVMALLLLTACGGSKGEEAAAENAVMNQIRARSASTQSLENDAELRRIAMQNLDSDIEAGYRNYLFKHKLHTKHTNDSVILTITAEYNYKDTNLEKLLDYILGDKGYDSDLNIKEDGNWTKVGVAVKNEKGRSYVAISIQVKK